MKFIKITVYGKEYGNEEEDYFNVDHIKRISRIEEGVLLLVMSDGESLIVDDEGEFLLNELLAIK